MTRRRSKGHGTLRKQDNGRWFGRIRKNGKEISITADTKKEAQEKLDQAAKRIGAQKWDRTVAEAVEPWLENPKWKPNTRKAYVDRANRLVLPYLGRHKLSQIDATAIKNALGAAHQDGHTDSNVQLLYTTLALILSYAKKQGWIAFSPIGQVEKPEVERRKPNPFTPAEAEQILQYCDETNDPYFTFYALTLTMGLRSTEARLARKMDLHGDYLHIPRQHTKTLSGERDVPVTAWVRKAMERNSHKGPYIVPSKSGGPLDKTTISRAWKRLLERIGLEHRRIHDCRHTCGSILALNGVPTRVIQQILGHSSEEMAVHYSQQTKENMRDAMQQFM